VTPLTVGSVSGVLATKPADDEACILIVDDNLSKRTALEAALAPLGHRVVQAQSGTDALRCLLVEDFAVILLDVHMPEIDGFETARLIRQRRQSEMTPILFITAYSSDEIEQSDHYAGGAVDFIFAPIPPAELRSKVSFFTHVFLDARRLAAQAEGVRASVQHLQLLTDSAPIGIFQTDRENRYVYTNPRWTELTGVTALQAFGQAWDSVVIPELRPELAVALSGGQELSHRVELVSEGSRRFVMVSSRPVQDVSGGPAGWVGTLADVTAEKEAEDTMSVARDAALSVNVMQRKFSASASHELRTPVASIIGYVEELLLSESLDPEDREMLDVVYRNAGRLNRLIDDLSLLNRAEIGAPLMKLEPTTLRSVVDGVVSSLSDSAQDRDVRLLTEYTDIPAVLVDPLRLEQSLLKLVANAVKFTSDGGSIIVRVGVSDGMATLAVVDTGAGIDSADFDKVFERFYRTRSAVDDAVPGSGLGLAIAKTMIEAQSGTIELESAPGVGSTFTVRLPFADAVAAAVS